MSINMWRIPTATVLYFEILYFICTVYGTVYILMICLVCTYVQKLAMNVLFNDLIDEILAQKVSTYRARTV